MATASCICEGIPTLPASCICEYPIFQILPMGPAPDDLHLSELRTRMRQLRPKSKVSPPRRMSASMTSNVSQLTEDDINTKLTTRTIEAPDAAEHNDNDKEEFFQRRTRRKSQRVGRYEWRGSESHRTADRFFEQSTSMLSADVAIDEQ